MGKRLINSFKLGVFVIAGLVFLILLLYMIGKNENLFGSNFVLKARFYNAQGLTTGNNVRFAGLQAGTVSSIKIINDTTVEVTMLIKTKLKDYIRANSLASIGTDGLMGNKLINIIPQKEPAPIVKEFDILESKKTVSMDDMMEVLDNTNRDVAIIASSLKTTVTRINESSAIWEIMNDKSLPYNIRQSVATVRKTTGDIENMVGNLQSVIASVKKGEGSLGQLLHDTSFVHNLNEAVFKIRDIGVHADTLSERLDLLVKNIQYDIEYGKGPANAMLKDSQLVADLSTTINSIEKGASSFNENMQALKNNFLFRGYFRKLEKQKKKQPVDTAY